MTAADSVQFAAEAIMAYLDRHAQSADTIEGIHGWWIDWANEPASILITEAALVRLEQAGAVERRRISNREIWRRAVRKPD